MKKLINFLLVLALGTILGYVFHNPIDNKLKDWFGTQRVEKGKIVIENGMEKTIDVGKAAIEAGERKN